MSVFQDEEFEQGCVELDRPQTDEYEFFLTAHDVTIYRKYDKETGLYQYKIYGFMLDIDPEVCVEVYMDLEYRKDWDSYAKELFETEGTNGKKVIYWNVNFPFPLWNRDYVYSRELRVVETEGQKRWVVLARSETVPTIPPKSGVVRVDQYIQKVALMADGNGGTKAFMHYFDNPKGNIPTWLINWAAKTGVPTFLVNMQKSCRGYPEYKRKKMAQGQKSDAAHAS